MYFRVNAVHRNSLPDFQPRYQPTWFAPHTTDAEFHVMSRLTDFPVERSFALDKVWFTIMHAVAMPTKFDIYTIRSYLRDDFMKILSFSTYV